MMAATIRAILVLVVFSVANFANAQPPSGSRSAPDQQSMSQAMLDAHNAVRARVGVPPLIWADQLAAVAQVIATNACSHRKQATPAFRRYAFPKSGEAACLRS
jgi:uncharacterized protein YkwD